MTGITPSQTNFIVIKPIAMKLAITIALVSISVSVYSQNPHKIRVEKMRNLKVMIGTWDMKTRMIPGPGKEIQETGTMHCISLYDSTYVECDVSLSNGKSKRGYKLFVTYDADSSRFSQIYLYSNSAIRITETGQFEGREFLSNGSYLDQAGKVETVSGLMRIDTNDNIYYESRSSAVNNEIDYIATFKRRQ